MTSESHQDKRPRAPAMRIGAAALLALALAGLGVLVLTAQPAPLAAQPTQATDEPEEHANRVVYEYGAPKTDALASVYKLMTTNGCLEKIQRIFKPFKFPIDVTLRAKSCDGLENAWYQRPDVTVCYEYILADILRNVPKETTRAGVTPEDAMVGPFIYTMAHEMGHAVFDLMNVPLFGRPEDAADQFSAYMMLLVGKTEARRLIGGAAYTYARYFDAPKITTNVTAFADVHSAPLARFYNLLCIAYGADPQQFGYVVQQGYLPADRARGCKIEFEEINYAFRNLIQPKLDPQMMTEVLSVDWYREMEPRASTAPSFIKKPPGATPYYRR